MSEFPVLAGWAVVFAHGDGAGGVVVAGRRVGGAEFAELIGGVLAPGALRVLLVVCGGAGAVAEGLSLAERVQAVSGRAVLAATGVVWQSGQGVRVAGGRLGGLSGSGEGWLWFAAGEGTSVALGGDLAGVLARIDAGCGWRRLGGMRLPRPVAWVRGQAAWSNQPNAAQSRTLLQLAMRVETGDPATGVGDGDPLGVMIRQAGPHLRTRLGLAADEPLTLDRLRTEMANQYSLLTGGFPRRYHLFMQPGPGDHSYGPMANRSMLRDGMPMPPYLWEFWLRLAADVFGLQLTLVLGDRVVTIGRPGGPEVWLLPTAVPTGRYLGLVSGTHVPIRLPATTPVPDLPTRVFWTTEPAAPSTAAARNAMVPRYAGWLSFEGSYDDTRDTVTFTELRTFDNGSTHPHTRVLPFEELVEYFHSMPSWGNQPIILAIPGAARNGARNSLQRRLAEQLYVNVLAPRGHLSYEANDDLRAVGQEQGGPPSSSWVLSGPGGLDSILYDPSLHRTMTELLPMGLRAQRQPGTPPPAGLPDLPRPDFRRRYHRGSTLAQRVTPLHYVTPSGLALQWVNNSIAVVHTGGVATDAALLRRVREISPARGAELVLLVADDVNPVSLLEVFDHSTVREPNFASVLLVMRQAGQGGAQSLAQAIANLREGMEVIAPNGQLDGAGLLVVPDPDNAAVRWWRFRRGQAPQPGGALPAPPADTHDDSAALPLPSQSLIELVRTPYLPTPSPVADQALLIAQLRATNYLHRAWQLLNERLNRGELHLDPQENPLAVAEELAAALLFIDNMLPELNPTDSLRRQNVLQWVRRGLSRLPQSQEDIYVSWGVYRPRRSPALPAPLSHASNVPSDRHQPQRSRFARRRPTPNQPDIGVQGSETFAGVILPELTDQTVEAVIEESLITEPDADGVSSTGTRALVGHPQPDLATTAHTGSLLRIPPDVPSYVVPSPAGTSGDRRRVVFAPYTRLRIAADPTPGPGDVPVFTADAAPLADGAILWPSAQLRAVLPNLLATNPIFVLAARYVNSHPEVVNPRLDQNGFRVDQENRAASELATVIAYVQGYQPFLDALSSPDPATATAARMLLHAGLARLPIHHGRLYLPMPVPGETAEQRWLSIDRTRLASTISDTVTLAPGENAIVHFDSRTLPLGPARIVSGLLGAAGPTQVLVPRGARWYISSITRRADGTRLVNAVLRNPDVDFFDRVPSGVPNGLLRTDHRGRAQVWVSGPDGNPVWQPFAQWVAHPTDLGRRLRGFVPLDQWLQHRDSAEIQALLADSSVFNSTQPGHDDVRMRVVPAGLAFYEPEGADLASMQAVNDIPPRTAGPTFVLGVAGQPLSQNVLALVRTVLARLSERLRRGGSLHVLGTLDENTSATVAQLALAHQLSLGGPQAPASPVSPSGGQPIPGTPVPETGTQPPAAPLPAQPSGPLPHHRIPAWLSGDFMRERPSVTDPFRGARVQSTTFAHGVAWLRGAPVVVNEHRYRQAYVVLRANHPGGPYAMRRLLGGVFHNSQRIELNADGVLEMFAAAPPNNQLRPDDLVLEVSVPAGAAIHRAHTALANGNNSIAARLAASTADYLLPPGTMAGVVVNATLRRGNFMEGNRPVYRPLDPRSLSVHVAGVPRPSGAAAGTRTPSAVLRTPPVGWTRETLATLLHGSGLTRSGVYYFAADQNATGPREQARRDAAQETSAEAGVTTFIVATHHTTGLPVIRGQQIAVDQFAQLLHYLRGEHPQLAQPVIRLAASRAAIPVGRATTALAEQLFTRLSIPIIATDASIFTARTEPGIPRGTIFATTLTAEGTATLPADGNWYAFSRTPARNQHSSGTPILRTLLGPAPVPPPTAPLPAAPQPTAPGDTPPRGYRRVRAPEFRAYDYATWRELTPDGYDTDQRMLNSLAAVVRYASGALDGVPVAGYAGGQLDRGLFYLPLSTEPQVYAAELPSGVDPTTLTVGNTYTEPGVIQATTRRAEAEGLGTNWLLRIRANNQRSAGLLLDGYPGADYGANTILIHPGQTFDVVAITPDPDNPTRTIIDLREHVPASTASPAPHPADPTTSSDPAGASDSPPAPPPTTTASSAAGDGPTSAPPAEPAGSTGGATIAGVTYAVLPEHVGDGSTGQLPIQEAVSRWLAAHPEPMLTVHSQPPTLTPGQILLAFGEGMARGPRDPNSPSDDSQASAGSADRSGPVGTVRVEQLLNAILIDAHAGPVDGAPAEGTVLIRRQPPLDAPTPAAPAGGSDQQHNRGHRRTLSFRSVVTVHEGDNANENAEEAPTSSGRRRSSQLLEVRDGLTRYNPHQPFNPGTSDINRPSRTAAGTAHVASAPEADAHPLRSDNSLVTASYQNAVDALGKSSRSQPGMGGALLIGDSLIPHSSMKARPTKTPHGKPVPGQTPDRHPVVQQVLDGLPEEQRARGHGYCAEVAAISNYLHEQDPNWQWTVASARQHFEHVGAATAAHQPKAGFPSSEPCASCQHLTGQLGIAWIDRPISEVDIGTEPNGTVGVPDASGVDGVALVNQVLMTSPFTSGPALLDAILAADLALAGPVAGPAGTAGGDVSVSASAALHRYLDARDAKVTVDAQFQAAMAEGPVDAGLAWWHESATRELTAAAADVRAWGHRPERLATAWDTLVVRARNGDLGSNGANLTTRTPEFELTLAQLVRDQTGLEWADVRDSMLHAYVLDHGNGDIESLLAAVSMAWPALEAAMALAERGEPARSAAELIMAKKGLRQAGSDPRVLGEAHKRLTRRRPNQATAPRQARGDKPVARSADQPVDTLLDKLAATLVEKVLADSYRAAETRNGIWFGGSLWQAVLDTAKAGASWLTKLRPVVDDATGEGKASVTELAAFHRYLDAVEEYKYLDALHNAENPEEDLQDDEGLTRWTATVATELAAARHDLHAWGHDPELLAQAKKELVARARNHQFNPPGIRAAVARKAELGPTLASLINARPPGPATVWTPELRAAMLRAYTADQQDAGPDRLRALETTWPKVEAALLRVRQWRPGAGPGLDRQAKSDLITAREDLLAALRELRAAGNDPRALLSAYELLVSPNQAAAAPAGSTSPGADDTVPAAAMVGSTAAVGQQHTGPVTRPGYGRLRSVPLLSPAGHSGGLGTPNSAAGASSEVWYVPGGDEHSDSEAARGAAAAAMFPKVGLTTLIMHADREGPYVNNGGYVTYDEFATEFVDIDTSTGPILLVTCGGALARAGNDHSFAEVLRDKTLRAVFTVGGIIYQMPFGVEIGPLKLDSNGDPILRWPTEPGQIDPNLPLEAGWQIFPETPGAEPELLGMDLAGALEQLRDTYGMDIQMPESMASPGLDHGIAWIRLARVR